MARSLVFCLALALVTACGDEALVSPACSDGVQNGGETGVDCGGGVCGVCQEGAGCTQHGDCATGVCGADGSCAPPSCGDGLQNGDETDVDCGGGCGACPAESSCGAAEDCASGVCDGGRCAAPACGDAVVNGDEACDDGGESAGCNADCSPATCGDFQVNHTTGETCDEGGVATETCDADCSLRSCGDATANTDAGEECDTGGNSATCDLDCTAPLCGDGLLNTEAAETCDTAGDSRRCDADCSPAACGDGYVNAAAGEDCEEGAVDTGTCDVDCSAAVCGDGYVNAAAGEECDGSGADTDSCDADCSAVACGDGYVNTAAGEDCEDGNTVTGDGCDPTCQIEVCGDGIIDGGAVQSLTFEWLATSCSSYENLVFSINGAVALQAGGGEPPCSCLPGISSATVTDPAVLALLADGDNHFRVEFLDSDTVVDDAIAWAVVTVQTDMANEIVIFDHDGGGDAEAREPDLCTAGYRWDTDASTTAAVSIGELCDDGNTSPGDGCRADCEGFEDCGDGILDTATGEHCDDGNTATGDGCDAACALEDPFVMTAPQVISGGLICTTAPSNSRKVGIGALGTVYVAMSCLGEAYVAVSDDRSTTYSAPTSLGITAVDELAIEGGPADTAYALAVTGSGALVFTRTIDGGRTWQMPTTLATGIRSTSWLSVDSRGDSLYITALSASGLLVWRNDSRGAGSFDSVLVDLPATFADVMADKSSNDVFIAGDTPALKVRRSTDGAVSFGDELNPPGHASFSDWAGSHGVLYAVGTDEETDIDVIPVSDPSTGFAAAGLPRIATWEGRAIDADGMGNAYVVSQLDNYTIQLDRLPVRATSVPSADTRVISSGTYPGVAALPSNDGAVVVFEIATRVVAAVVVY